MEEYFEGKLKVTVVVFRPSDRLLFGAESKFSAKVSAEPNCKTVSYSWCGWCILLD